MSGIAAPLSVHDELVLVTTARHLQRDAPGSVGLPPQGRARHAPSIERSRKKDLCCARRVTTEVDSTGLLHLLALWSLPARLIQYAPPLGTYLSQERRTCVASHYSSRATGFMTMLRHVGRDRRYRTALFAQHKGHKKPVCGLSKPTGLGASVLGCCWVNSPTRRRRRRFARLPDQHAGARRHTTDGASRSAQPRTDRSPRAARPSRFAEGTWGLAPRWCAPGAPRAYDGRGRWLYDERSAQTSEPRCRDYGGFRPA